ncbi:hypothetical protein B7P43_G14264 [Cryptotermes secundus]|uniref:F-box domain-containing protein n=1 Tax=Cryptotermes secundus TaxID=105785 RepID=A0A2J7PH69_9NEOP|nr:hypothetical protein B7P43_G14264 [Cryptotermes secundus]
MPKLKQPCKLQDLVMLRVVKMLRKACESWIRALREAALTGSVAYLKETQNVTADCDTVHELLTSLLTGISAQQAALILKEIIPVITNYDDNCWELKRASWYQDEKHNTVCVKMLRAVLPAGAKEFVINCRSSGFAQKLIIQTLATVPDLTALTFHTNTEINNSALLASNIHHLKNLQEFEYFYHCTDDVVEQLGLHCTELKTVNLRESLAVTDTSIRHLMKLRKLEYLNLTYTDVSFPSYGSLLSRLPMIRNIDMLSLIDDVFNYIRKQELCTVTQFSGFIHNINIVRQKCPNLTKAKVYTFNKDLKNLTALIGLVNLHIINGNYEKCNLGAVLIGMGHRLIDLCLYDITDVNIAHIVMPCSSLKRLVLKGCTFVSQNKNSALDTYLPHYKSLIILKLIGNSSHQTDFHHLRYYDNLQVFECKGLDILTDDFIRDATRQGAFRNILRFWVEDTGLGALTMSTVELLLQHCEHLREIGLLRSWRRVTLSQCSDLIERMRSMNFDLQLD